MWLGIYRHTFKSSPQPDEIDTMIPHLREESEIELMVQCQMGELVFEAIQAPWNLVILNMTKMFT